VPPQSTSGNDGDNEEGAGGGGSGGTVYLVAATLTSKARLPRQAGWVGGTTTITTEVRTGNSATTGGRGLSAASASTILRRRHPRRHCHTAGRLHRFNLSERRGRPRKLNGQYTHGTHEYARTDGSMVIRRGDRRQGDYGWNFCRASAMGSSWSRAITSFLARAK
jgi:hypothetical protein